MNPIPEEVGATARSFIDKMKDPALLALLACNVALLVFIFYALFEAGKFRADMLQLLAKCTT